MKTTLRSGGTFCPALIPLTLILTATKAYAAPPLPSPFGKTAGGKIVTRPTANIRSGTTRHLAPTEGRMPTRTLAQQTPVAATRMNESGPENLQMAQRAGIWDVVETVWESPDAPPTTNRLVAERKMIGAFLQEILQPAPNSAAADIKRIDYLSFNRVEGRWKYVSMDTRAAVGLMPATSYGRGENGTIILTFDPFAVPGSGMNVTGQLLRMEQRIIQKDADHDQKDQYFVMADGNGEKRLAHRYAYVRRQAQLK